MAEAKETEQQQETRPSRLPWILLVVVVLAGGAGAAYFVMSGGKTEAEAASTPRMGPLLSLETMIVNLDAPGGNRYLKVGMELELTRELDEATKTLLPRLRDRIIVHLSALSVAQVQKPETKLAIKKKIAAMANEVFGRKLVKAVYFKELVMQ